MLFGDPGKSSDYLKGRSLSLKAKVDFIQSFSSKYEPPRCKLKVETSHEIKQPQGAEFHIGSESLMYILIIFFPHRLCFRSPLSFLLHLIVVLFRDYLLTHKQ